MATEMITERMTATDRFMAWAMMAGLALAIVQIGQGLALPAHFV